MVENEWAGFRRAPDGTLCLNGWAVFGHILPRFALLMFPCFADGVTVDEIGDAPDFAAFERLGFCIEWLGAGFCVAIGDVEPRAR